MFVSIATCTRAVLANGLCRAQPTRKSVNGTSLYPAIMPAWVDGMTLEGVSRVNVVGGGVWFEGRERYWSMQCVNETTGSEVAFSGGWACDNGTKFV